MSPTITRALTAAAAAALLVDLAAAQAAVTPPEFTSVRGSTANNAPLGDGPEFTYQQIHTDVPVGRLFNQLALRQGDISGSFRIVEAELWLADSDYDRRSTTFADNFRGFVTQVMARRQVALNDWSQPPPGGYPAPFDAVFPFDNPYATVPGVDLCWQLVIHTNTAGFAPYAVDTAWYQDHERYPGTPSGTGCVPTAQAYPTSLDSLFVTTASLQTWDLTWEARELVPGQPASILLGATDPNAPVAGFCTELRVAGIYAAFTGLADAGGVLASPVLTLPFNPAFLNFTFYAQAFGVDPGRAGLRAVASNGLASTLYELGPVPVEICRIHAQSATATTGVLEDHMGLITEFR